MTSFRARLAVATALLAGAVVAAFGAGTWWLVRDLRIARIDSDVRVHAEREAGHWRSPASWRDMEARLMLDLGVRDRREILLLVLDATGQPLHRSDHWPAGLAPDRLPWPAPAAGHPREAAGPAPAPNAPPRRPPPRATSTGWQIEGHEWRLGLAASGDQRVLVAVAAGIVDAEMAGLRNALLVSLPLALLLSALGAWLVSGRALRPLTHLRETARRLRAADLHQRISPAGEDTEFAELIEVLNDMFERLQRSFQQARRFSADAAHELKTPLAILQGQLERAIARVEAGSVLQGELSGILDEVRRLSVISQKLLLLARADAGHLALALAPVPLSALLDDLVEDARMLAPSLQVTADIHPGLQVMADVGLLRQVLHNLIGNAVKYNLPAGWIRLSAVASATRAEVRIANACQEIPEGSRYRLFERFYRADAPHSRQVDGVGLGLSVSLEIARAHGGNLTLAAAGPDRAEFLLTLPLAPADTAPDHPGGHPHRDNGSPASV